MITNTTNDIVSMAVNLAAIEEINYMRHSTITQILNAEFTSLLELLIDQDDAAFCKTMTIKKKESYLPDDFYRLRSVKSNNIDTTDYHLLNNKILFDNDKEHTIEYWYKPPTLTYAAPVEDFTLDTRIYDSLEDRIVCTEGIYNLKTQKTEDVDEPQNTYLTTNSYITTENNGVLRYPDFRVESSSYVPSSTVAYVDSSNMYAYYTKNNSYYKIDLSTGDVADSDCMLYTLGDHLLMIKDDLIYVDGIALYQKTDEVHPLKIDIGTGYGFIMGEKLYSITPTVSLNFPSNLYYIVLAYRLAVAMSVILGKDVNGLQLLLAQKEEQLLKMARRNLAQVNHIKNVYKVSYGY